MNTYAVFLRGINAGGHHRMPMAEFRSLLEGIGCQDAKTYIQSGNAVLRIEEDEIERLTTQIDAAIREQFGYSVPVVTRTREQLKQAIEANPFPTEGVDPKTIHFFFLGDTSARVDLAGARELAREGESLERVEGTLYLHAPEGLAQSKVAERMPRLTASPITGRNLRTVLKVAEMAETLNDT